MNAYKNILLVEDSTQDIELTLTALSEHNLANTVVVVRDGEEALNYLYRRSSYSSRTNENPAVILLDLKMPKVDGIQVLREIKNNEQLKSIPVVMLTSSGEESDLVESYKLGANAYVVKPVGFEDFVRAVSQLGIFWAWINEPPTRTSGI